MSILDDIESYWSTAQQTSNMQANLVHSTDALICYTNPHFCRYVDGKSYMASVAKALLEAKEEIFITDWM